MQKIKVLGISGSPRKKGNSAYLLERALSAAANVAPEAVQTESYTIAGKKISGCISCFKCMEKQDCIIEDDFHALRDKWIEADTVLYSIPVYHMGIPGQLKCFIDRLGNSLYCKFGGLQKNLKTVGVITQGCHIFAGQEQVMTAVINHALVMGCVPVSGDPWQSYIGAGGWTCNALEADSLSRFYEEKETDAVAAVEAAESLGKRAVQMAMLLKNGALACKDMLNKEGVFSVFLNRATP